MESWFDMNCINCPPQVENTKHIIYECCIVKKNMVNSWKYIGFFNTMEACSCWVFLGK